MRVLYVDDDRINVLLFEETCRVAGGFQIATASSGAEALDVIADFAPDVLVLDLHLPDTNGYALLAALRAAGRSDTPAFLCTADSLWDVANKAVEAGFQGCWLKPVVLQSMLDDLARVGPADGGRR